MSRSRSDSISTIDIVPEWVEVLVPDNEVALYRKTIKNPLLVIPHEIEGLGAVRNWVLDNFKEETVIMLDDDFACPYALTEEVSRRIEDPEEVVQILINTAVMAKDLGVHCFGFSQTDIRKYNGCEPFSLCTWVGGVIGVIGRKYRFRQDKFKVDIDFCLQNLLVDRIIFQDNRYKFTKKRDNNKGGNSAFRTEESFNQSIKSLQDKWGDCLNVGDFKNQVKIRLNVKRRQPIEY